MNFMETDSLKVFPYVCSQYIPSSRNGSSDVCMGWKWLQDVTEQSYDSRHRGWPLLKDRVSWVLASFLQWIWFQRLSTHRSFKNVPNQGLGRSYPPSLPTFPSSQPLAPSFSAPDPWIHTGTHRLTQLLPPAPFPFTKRKCIIPAISLKLGWV